MTAIRKLNKMHFTADGRSLAGHYDAQELETASRLTILARQHGLNPSGVKQGFRSHNPILTMADGSRWMGCKSGGFWELTELDGDGAIQEAGFPVEPYEDYEEDA